MNLQIALAKASDAANLADILNQANNYKFEHGDKAWGTELYTVKELKTRIDWAASEAARHGRQLLRLDCPSTNKELCNYYLNQDFRLVEQRRLPGYETKTAFFERQTK